MSGRRINKGEVGRSVRWMRARQRALLVAVAAGATALPAATALVQPAHADTGTAQRVIVEAASDTAALSDVSSAGGSAIAALASSGGAAALMTPTQQAAAEAQGAVVVPDNPVGVAATTSTATHPPSAVYPQVTDASPLVSAGVNGAGVAVAVLDTGIDASLPDLAGRVIDGVDFSGEGNPYQDSYGHGTFVAGLIASSGVSSGGAVVGEAPGANLVAVKVAGASGATDEATVIRGIDWVISHRAQDNIRVLNISLGANETESTTIDPVDRAVESAWNAGIVVVVSAGNGGPSNGTIAVPGDDPAVITVGAIDDGGGTNPSGYSMTTFSGVGPTSVDGWYKPDLVAPGRSVISLADPGSTVYDNNPSAVVGSSGFVGSGTSFSAAITSGAAALLIQHDPALTPAGVKGLMLGTAAAGPVGDPFVDGHGLLDVAAAASAPLVSLTTPRTAGAQPGATVGLPSTWASSSWNSANWNGATWNGATWNGATWNGATWNGATWNGATWNGATWN